MLKRIFASLILVVSVFAVPAVVHAQNKTTTLPSSEVHEGDYFATGEVVEISGTVNGDVYAAGGQVFVDGTVNGDLIVAGGMVNVSGTVTESIRAAGGSMTISGQVGKNISLAGGNIDLTKGAYVGGNLVVFGGNVTVNSVINGNIKAGVGNLTLAGDVGGNVDAGTGTLRLTSNSKIGGDLTYFSEEAISIADQSSVAGTITQKQVPNVVKKSNQAEVDKFFKGVGAFGFLVSVAATFILGFVLLRLFPNFLDNASQTLSKNPVKSIGLGFLAIIVVPITIVLMLITIVGIPLAVLSGALFFSYVYVTRVVAMLAFGMKFNSLAKTNIKSMLGVFVIGLIVYYALGLIPFIGGFVKLFTVFAGLGAAIWYHKQAWEKARKAKIL